MGEPDEDKRCQPVLASHLHLVVAEVTPTTCPSQGLLNSNTLALRSHRRAPAHSLKPRLAPTLTQLHRVRQSLYLISRACSPLLLQWRPPSPRNRNGSFSKTRWSKTIPLCSIPLWMFWNVLPWPLICGSHQAWIFDRTVCAHRETSLRRPLGKGVPM